MVRDIERVLGKPIERRRLEGFDYGSFAPENQQPAPKQSVYRSRGFHSQARGGHSPPVPPLRGRLAD